MRPEGNGDTQDPSLIEVALKSKGSWDFLEIPSYSGRFMGKGSRNSS